MSDLGRLLQLLRTRSYRTGDFVLSSGRRSSYYIDARPTTMSAEGQLLAGRLGLAAIREQGWRPDAVGGLTMGADPVAYAIAHASATDPPVLDAFSVRKEAKGHGAGKRVEGNFEPGTSVVVVEDVITTGASAIAAIEAVEAEQGRVAGVLALVDREEGGRETVEKRLGSAVVVITTITQIAGLDQER